MCIENGDTNVELSPTSYRFYSRIHGYQCNPYAEFLSMFIITGTTNLFEPTSSYTAAQCGVVFFLILVALYARAIVATSAPAKKHTTHVTETAITTVVVTDKSNDSVLFSAVTDGPKV